MGRAAHVCTVKDAGCIAPLYRLPERRYRALLFHECKRYGLAFTDIRIIKIFLFTNLLISLILNGDYSLAAVSCSITNIINMLLSIYQTCLLIINSRTAPSQLYRPVFQSISKHTYELYINLA